MTRLKTPWCWGRLKAGGEGDDRRWDGWMASLTQWTWIWVNSRSWWWTGRPGMLPSMGCRVRHNWATELNQTDQFIEQYFHLLSYFTSSHIFLSKSDVNLKKENKTNAILTCDNGCSVLQYFSTICYFMVGLVSSTPRTLLYYFTCKGDDRGWDAWMASLTQWTWVWINSGSWWWTGRPGMLRFMGLQRVGHNWATEVNWFPDSMYFNI